MCVCVCLHLCIRDFGGVTINVSVVNSHQPEQTGRCLFLRRSVFALVSPSVSTRGREIYSDFLAAIYSFTGSSNWP